VLPVAAAELLLQVVFGSNSQGGQANSFPQFYGYVDTWTPRLMSIVRRLRPVWRNSACWDGYLR
jgi:hypothetical protein